MNTSLRDPKVDPLPGDILSVILPNGEILRKTVISIPNEELVCEMSSNGVISTCWLSVWMEWAKNATIERKEEDQIGDIPEVPNKLSFFQRLFLKFGVKLSGYG